MKRERLAPLLVVLASASTLAVSMAVMAPRVAAYYASADHHLYVFEQVFDREFTYAGVPVSLADTQGPEGPGVTLRYGDQTMQFTATMKPGSAQMPGLTRHRSWMQVLRFADQSRMSVEQLHAGLDAGIVKDRLVVVTLDPRQWADGRPLGAGQAKDWVFDLHELLPDGTIRSERFGYPLSRRAARTITAGGVQPLEEGSWQYYAALMIIPTSSKPTPRFTRDAMTVMGWTFPAAALSGLALTLSIPWLFAPRRPREGEQSA